MKPAFKAGGVTTAGNASIISDGAAAVVVMARDKAEALGCKILATIGAQASAGIDMKYVLVAPIWAVPKVLKKEGILEPNVASAVRKLPLKFAAHPKAPPATTPAPTH